MNKKNALWLILNLIFLIVFNVVFFVVGGTDHEASVWISYAFIHVAYIMLWITPLLVRKGSKSTALGFPLYTISAVYFIVVFLVSLIIMLIHPNGFKAALVIQIILFGIYAVLLVANMIANEYSTDNIEKREEEIKYVKECASKLKGIADIIEDSQLRKQVEKSYDFIYSSPIKSNIDVRDYEVAVTDSIETLEENIASKDFETAKVTIAKILKDANERNRRLKY